MAWRACLQSPGGKCFSRAEPKHKQDIVRLFKDLGEVAAMTGPPPKPQTL